MEKKSQVSEWNFTVGTVLHYLCVVQCVKLSFIIKIFGINFSNLVLIRYCKRIEK